MTPPHPEPLRGEPPPEGGGRPAGTKHTGGGQNARHRKGERHSAEINRHSTFIPAPPTQSDRAARTSFATRLGATSHTIELTSRRRYSERQAAAHFYPCSDDMPLSAFHTRIARLITHAAISFAIVGHVSPCFFIAHPTKQPAAMKSLAHSTPAPRHDSHVSACTSRQRHATITRTAPTHPASATHRARTQRPQTAPATRQATKNIPCLHFTRSAPIQSHAPPFLFQSSGTCAPVFLAHTQQKRHVHRKRTIPARQRHATIRRSAAAHHASDTPRFAGQRLHITPAPRHDSHVSACTSRQRHDKQQRPAPVCISLAQPEPRPASAQQQKHCAPGHAQRAHSHRNTAPRLTNCAPGHCKVQALMFRSRVTDRKTRTPAAQTERARTMTPGQGNESSPQR
jgi:hypothetical protein